MTTKKRLIGLTPGIELACRVVLVGLVVAVVVVVAGGGLEPNPGPRRGGKLGAGDDILKLFSPSLNHRTCGPNDFPVWGCFNYFHLFYLTSPLD